MFRPSPTQVRDHTNDDYKIRLWEFQVSLFEIQVTYPCGFACLNKQRRVGVFSFRCVWSPSQRRVAFYLAYQDKSTGGKNPVYVKPVFSAAIPFAVSHEVSFVVQLSWKIAMLTGGF